MAPVPGPCISEPTLRVGFCIALDSVGAIAGHSPAGKKPRIPRRGARLWGCTPPRPPKEKSNRKNREKRLERLFFHRFFRFSTSDSGVPEPPQRKNSGLFSTFPIGFVENRWEFLCLFSLQRRTFRQPPRSGESPVFPGMPVQRDIWLEFLCLLSLQRK